MPIVLARSMMRSWNVLVWALWWIGTNALAPPHQIGTRSGGVVTTSTAESLRTTSDGVGSRPTRLQASTRDAYDDGIKSMNHDRIGWSRRGALKELGAFGAAACGPIVLLGPSSTARADDASGTSGGDLTSRMFNPDGSIKQGFESTAAQFRTITINWDGPTDDSFASNVDGVNNVGGSQRGEGSVRISYRLPEKWATGNGGDELYFDRTEGVNAKACRRITVFRAAGSDATESQLEKATTVGIAKSLRVPSDLSLLESADLVSGRTSTKDGQRYFDFDMAVAPKTCDQSKEDLGLGFCPYDSIYLLSATVLDGHLYVMVVESDKDEWKRANSDLKLVRNSFQVSRPRDDASSAS